MDGPSEMPGAPAVQQPPKEACPSCRAAITRLIPGQAKFFGCPSCGDWFSISARGNLQPTKLPAKRWHSVPRLLKPGRAAKVGDVEYKIIASANKADKEYPEFTWREYTLFHPLHGYLWFSEFNGHWLKLHRIAAPALSSKTQTATHEDRTYRLFQRSRSTTLTAIGEFAENAREKRPKYEEYIAPPYLLSLEAGASYREWFLGEHVERDEVAKVFGLEKEDLPSQSGIGPAQPRKIKFTQSALIRLSVVAMALVIVLQIIFSSSAAERQVVQMNENFPDSLSGATVSSPSFLLEKDMSNLDFAYSSDVSNNWSEADIELVNEQTGESRGLSLGAEYYFGADSDGPWSEGSRSSDGIISSVEPGRYHVNVKNMRGTTGSGGQSFQLTGVYDVCVDSNFYVIMALILIFPVANYLLGRQFEKSRWMDSDYSPFYSEEES